MSSEAVASLVRRLEASLLDGDAIHRALSAELDEAAVFAQARFEDERYVRVPLHVGASFEVRLLCWQPGQSSALHAHGQVNGAMRILRGKGVERRLGLADRALEPGMIAPVEPGVVHQVANTGSEALVSLHVYAPPLPVEQPSAGEGRHVVIVGGGWSGVAVAIQLLRRGGPYLRLVLVEPSEVGRGVAYGAASVSPTLNVPAGRMGLDSEQPEDFLAYARERGVSANARSLLSRRLYGDYVVDRLAKAIAASPARLRLERGRVARVSRGGPTPWTVTLADGRALPAEHVVLASGHGPTRVPEVLREAGVPVAIGTDLLARPDIVPAGERVLLLGTGLTALDVVGLLESRGQVGPLHVASLTGKWPHRHLATLAWTGEAFVVDPATLPDNADGLAGWFEAAIGDARARGIAWQAVVDAVRPHIVGAWRRMSLEEQGRFLRIYRPEWERLRHRAPAAQVDFAEGLEKAGTLHRHKGTIEAARATATGWELALGDARVEVDRVVLCTGPSSDPRGFTAPWPEMLMEGHAQADAHGLGVCAGLRGEILPAEGAAAGLWAIGGLLRPRDFESTAVPELAKQAATLGAAIAEALG